MDQASPVEAPTQPLVACLVTIGTAEQGERFDVPQGGAVLGSRDDADVHLPGMEPTCACIEWRGGLHLVAEPGSEVTLNGRSVVAAAALRGGELLELGPFRYRVLVADARQELDDAYRDEIFRLSNYDEHTGVLSERNLRALLEREVDRARRYQTQIGLMMIRLDSASALGTNPGEAAAEHRERSTDELLSQVAQRLQTRLRDSDVIGAMGERTFIVLLHQVSATEGSRLSEEIRTLLEGSDFRGVSAHVKIAFTLVTARTEGDAAAVLGWLNDRC